MKNIILSICAGVTVFLAFPVFDLYPLIFLFPLLCNYLIFSSRNIKESFLFGFISSYIIMLGGFYWISYVIHVFGYLPWSVSIVIYLFFSLFGALNFPIFFIISFVIKKRFSLNNLEEKRTAIYYLFLLPAIFTLVEFITPKLFPWYIGHSLSKALFINQIAEITGSSFLSFLIYSFGSSLFLILKIPKYIKSTLVLIPLIAAFFCIAFSLIRLNSSYETDLKLKIALIQANIGSLEKVEAKGGITNKVRYVIEKYKNLSEKAIKENVDLIIWPETAIPFQLVENTWSKEIFEMVKKCKVPLLSGAYAPAGKFGERDYNAAFLLERDSNGDIKTQIYMKNILLAFGEYLPFGELFPKLYRLFPQVSNFVRGRTQEVMNFSSIKLGVTICYEAIIPSFYRKILKKRVSAVVNLTNDSWFGPTSEPYQHAALSVFRAIESRVPLIRIANTGTSFFVDSFGRLSRMSKIYTEDVVISEVNISKNPTQTFYIRFGEWFNILSALFVVIYILFWRKRICTHT